MRGPNELRRSEAGDVCEPDASLEAEETERLCGVGADVVAVVGLGVAVDDVSFDAVVVVIDGLLDPFMDVPVFDVESTFLRLRREDCSFSALSITTLEIRTNSEHMPSMRCTPPCSAS